MVPPSRKRNVRHVSSSDDDEDVVKRSKSNKKVVLIKEFDSEYDVEQDVHDISPIKNLQVRNCLLGFVMPHLTTSPFTLLGMLKSGSMCIKEGFPWREN